MENEIELKIMLWETHIPRLQNWITALSVLTHETETLANCYYDTPNRDFAQQKMGLRVRTKNHQHEITLKMAGDIVGGLHIRPEYHLPLADNQPDLKRLLSHYHLQLAHGEAWADNLIPLFHTDFVREKYLIQYQHAQIEIALDQGVIKNAFGEAPICELELELKTGELADLIALLATLPRLDGMWLSSLSKAQRGYFVGNRAAFDQQVAALLATQLADFQALSPIAQYQFTQQLVDFLRLDPDNALLKNAYTAYCPAAPFEPEYWVSQAYLNEHLTQLEQLLATH